jgi:hypothetical protein
MVMLMGGREKQKNKKTKKQKTKKQKTKKQKKFLLFHLPRLCSPLFPNINTLRTGFRVSFSY